MIRASSVEESQPVREGFEGSAYYALMTQALSEILQAKKLVTEREIEAFIAGLEAPQPEWGAHLVARAWIDGKFKRRLLENGRAAAAELGYTIKEAELVVVENTPDIHNLIVCTLCSCYPRSLLGQPPWWYISKAYRARAVREPRAVLKEFGLELPPHTSVRVHDSNADMRYLVLPMRPDNTGHLIEQELMALVSRDAMIGTAAVGAISEVARPG
ncbi:MAG: nitrile hydratase subunit alpha [Methylobacteriaceae bacterium]|nr:nitrile hydratase subunit alpha [Methylobacteriaceae bacterium]